MDDTIKSSLERTNQILEELGIKNILDDLNIIITDGTNLQKCISYLCDVIIRKSSFIGPYINFLPRFLNNKDLTIELSELFFTILTTLNTKASLLILDQWAYALWMNRDLIYDIGDLDLLKYIIPKSIEMSLKSKNYNGVIEKYLIYAGYFEEYAIRDYSKILSLEEMLAELDVLWDNNYDNSSWGICYDYIPSKDSFFDKAGPLGNLVYLRYFIRKKLNLFVDINSEFDYLEEQIITIVNCNNPLVGIYIFYLHYDFHKTVLDLIIKNDYYRRFSRFIKKLHNILKNKHSKNHFVLSHFYKWAVSFTFEFEYFKNQIFYWKKYLKEFYSQISKHNRHIFTNDNLDKLNEHNQFINYMFIQYGKNIKILKKLRKICWDLVIFYEKAISISWSLTTVLSIRSLDKNQTFFGKLFSKKRKSYYKKKIKKIVAKTIDQYNNPELDIEYLLLKKRYIFILDSNFLSEFLRIEEKVKYINKRINQLDELKNKSLKEKYFVSLLNLLLKLNKIKEIESVLEKILEIYNNQPNYRDPNQLNYLLLKEQIKIRNQFGKLNLNIIESIKNDLENSVNKFFNDSNPFLSIKKEEYGQMIDFLIDYIDIYGFIKECLNLLRSWTNSIRLGSSKIQIEWDELKSKILSHQLQIELFLTKNLKREQNRIIFVGIKKILNLLNNYGYFLLSVIEGKNSLDKLENYFEKSFNSYSYESSGFSKIIKKRKKKENLSLDNIRIVPSLINLKTLNMLEKSNDIICINKYYNRINNEFELRFRIPKKLLEQDYSFYLKFFENEDFKKKWIKEHYYFGIQWIDDNLKIKPYEIPWRKVDEINSYFEIDVNIKFNSPPLNDLYFIPFIKNEITGDIYGQIDSLNFFQKKLPNILRKLEVDFKENVPFLTNLYYEKILEICYEISRNMQSAPSGYSKLDEPELRHIILNTLNTHFEGRGSAEAFNKKGKADFIINYKNENIFIAECKIWRGPEKFKEAFIQLYGYITYDDTKAALLIFNKNNVMFKEILETAKEVIKNQPLFKKFYIPENEKIRQKENLFNSIFNHPEDQSKNIFLSTIIFDVYHS